MIKQYVSDYRFNLIDGGNIKDAKRFRSDLQILFEVLRYKGDKEALFRYVRDHDSYFGGIDRETWEAYQEFLQIGDGRMNAFFDKNAEGETVNMCKALEDLYADGVAAGREAGFREMKKKIIGNMLGSGMADAAICSLAECTQSMADEVRGTVEESSVMR